MAAKTNAQFRKRSFLLTSSLSGGLLIIAFLRGFEGLFSASSITIALLLGFWYWTRNVSQKRATILFMQAVILLAPLGAAFNLVEKQLAGTSYDTYMHLLTAFVTTLLASSFFLKREIQKPHVYAALLIFGLGLGVELLEILDGILFLGNDLGRELSTCLQTLCYYWQDTLKDLLNNFLGIILATISWRQK